MASSLSTDDRRELDDILARLVALEEKLFGGAEQPEETTDVPADTTGVTSAQS